MKFGGKDLPLKGQTTEEIVSAILEDEQVARIILSYVVNALFEASRQGHVRYSQDGKSLRWYEE